MGQLFHPGQRLLSLTTMWEYLVKYETKNYIMGEGTDRSRFYRRQIDKYTWIAKGSSYLLSELNVAYESERLLRYQLTKENIAYVCETIEDFYRLRESRGRLLRDFYEDNSNDAV